jgi:hypothetical protein
MKLIKGSLAGLVLAGILAVAPTAAFAHGGGGGGHGGGFGGGGGHFGGFAGGGGGAHFGGGGHFGGFAGRSFAGPSFAQHQGAHFVQRGDFRDRGHFRDRDHFRGDGDFFFGGPFWDDYSYYGYDYPYYGYDYPYYGYYDDYSAGQSSAAEVTPSKIIAAVQRELAQRGYYHGRVDGLAGPQTEKAIRLFQSVDHLPATGQIDDRMLKALRIS